MSSIDSHKRALKVAILYLFAGVAWILFTDYTAYSFSGMKIELLAELQVYKGLIYVLLTTILVYFLAKIALDRQARELEARLENERRLNSLTDHTRAGIYEVDRNGNAAFINDRFTEITGITSTIELQNKLAELIHPDDRERITRQWTEALHNRDPIHEEYRIIVSQGETTWILEEGHAWFNDAGEFSGYISTFMDITERKLLERSLWMDNFAVKKAGDMIFWIDKNSQFQHVNKTACQVLGYSYNELLTMYVFDVDTDFTKSNWDKLAEKLKVNDSATLESSIKTRNGETFPIEIRANYVEFENELHICAVARDITERKKVEKELKLNSFAIERTGDAVYWMKSDASFYFVNNAACENLGYSREELLEMSVFDIDPDVSRNDWNAIWERLLKEKSLTAKSRHQTKSGEVFPIEVRANYIELEGVSYDCAVVRDISERLEAEQALNEARARLEHLMNANPTVMYSTRVVDGKIVPVWASQSLERILGYSVDEALQPGWWVNHIHEKDREQCVERMRKIQEKDNLTHTYRFYHKNGSILWIRDELRILRDEQNCAVEVIGVWNDITEQTETENKLRQIQKLDAIGKLTSGIAHDFNNRLTVILGNMQLLERQLEHDSNLRPLINSAIQAAKTGATLTQRLLSFSRQQILETEITNLNELIHGINTLFENTLGEIISIDLRLQKDLWPVNIDPSQMEEVMLNLCVNARDAMPEGGKLVIETSNFTIEDDIYKESYRVMSGDYIRLSISDNGQGMSPDTQRRVFEPFFTTKKSGESGGTGLGLPMVYGFVKQSGGYISVYSEEEHGTTVNIYLPRAKEKVPAGSGQRAESGGETRELASIIKGIRALVVEDDELVRNISRLLLTELGFNVIEAENAVEGLQIMETSENIDLVFTDMMMPGGMNGVEMITEMRRRNPALRAIVVSGYSEDTTINTREMNIIWLKKPFTRSSLVDKISEVFRQGGPE